MASGRFPTILEVHFQSPEAGGKKTDIKGRKRPHPPHGCREPDLGRTSHPRRTAHAGSRCLRANDFPLDEASPERSRTSQAMAHFSSESPGSRRRDGFFTVPSVTFRVLYCFFVISHDRRRILHFNVTRHPTSPWIVQQLREAFPFGSASRYVIFDHDAKYGLEVPNALRSLRMEPVRTSFESPWQNGVAERWVESCRRDLLDRIIAMDERHLKQLLAEYVHYYHEDRTHLGLGKGTPSGRTCSNGPGRILCQERISGLHHRYDRAA
jgi:transposase InsO family protein